VGINGIDLEKQKPIDFKQEAQVVKMLFVVIQPNKLQAVREALLNIGVQRMTVLDAQGYGRQKGFSASYRGVEYRVNLLRKVTLEICVNDDFLERTIETISSIARTGSEGAVGDGKIFVVPTLEAITIDDQVRGPGAV
jgi:nitrogen regulatory protein P-II 2